MTEIERRTSAVRVITPIIEDSLHVTDWGTPVLSRHSTGYSKFLDAYSVLCGNLSIQDDRAQQEEQLYHIV